LAMHDGYVSCARFLNENKLLSCSGDSTAILWDLVHSVVVNKWKDHGGDVMSISVCPTDDNQFVSGACDTFARIFDLRDKRGAVMKFEGHESDINSVSWMPDGKSFVSGSDDSTVRLFDVRAYQEVQFFTDECIFCGITSVDPTKSGRIIFAGYDDYSCKGWDALTGENPHQFISVHENRVSCLGVQADGGAVATGSWDTHLIVWA
jgi:guanine nucleotide-binding protein G(I)/G(S)/G(T) subunit beta-1